MKLNFIFFENNELEFLLKRLKKGYEATRVKEKKTNQTHIILIKMSLSNCKYNLVEKFKIIHCQNQRIYTLKQDHFQRICYTHDHARKLNVIVSYCNWFYELFQKLFLFNTSLFVLHFHFNAWLLP